MQVSSSKQDVNVLETAIACLREIFSSPIADSVSDRRLLKRRMAVRLQDPMEIRKPQCQWIPGHQKLVLFDLKRTLHRNTNGLRVEQDRLGGFFAAIREERKKSGFEEDQFTLGLHQAFSFGGEGRLGSQYSLGGHQEID